MYSQFKSFFNKHDIFYQKQYDFWDHYSTEHTILDIVNKIQENLDKGKFLCGVFIDLQKAFDTVNHYILLQKVNHCVRVCVVIYDWFHSYLIERTQSTLIESRVSKKGDNPICGPSGLCPWTFIVCHLYL